MASNSQIVLLISSNLAPQSSFKTNDVLLYAKINGYGYISSGSIFVMLKTSFKSCLTSNGNDDNKLPLIEQNNKPNP